MSDYMPIDKAALDRHITGNYGEDQFKHVKRLAPKRKLTSDLPIPVKLYASKEFLFDILTTVVETPFGEWFEFRDITYHNDHGGAVLSIASAMVKYDSPDGDEGDKMGGPVQVDAKLIRLGIMRILSQRLVNTDLTAQVLVGLHNRDAGEIDSVVADAILQAAIFGKVIFG